MIRWRVILSIVIAPTLVATAFVIWLGIAGAAIIPAGGLAQLQGRDPNAVVEPHYIKYWAPLKLARIAQLQPEVIFTGTSRCQEFRSAMLRPYRAYNACLSGWNLEQDIDMLRHVFAVSHPRVVIIALDYFMFTEDWARAWQIKGAAEFNPGKQILGGIYDLFAALRKEPREAFDYALMAARTDQYDSRNHNRLVGMDAIHNRAGFRYDGSFLLPPSWIQEANLHAADLNLFVQAFPGAEEVSPHQLERLKVLADLARQNGATLIGVQLPIFKNVPVFLETNEAYRPYAGIWREFESPAFRDRISAMGIHFFDMVRDPVSENANYFFDPAHPGETGTLCVLARLEENADFKAIFPELDGDSMRRTCASATAKGQFFDIYRNEF